jgi:predicted pyridoxine 5'-phosphate oxidase superfamily flavin-nucleotide-binding protein
VSTTLLMDWRTVRRVRDNLGRVEKAVGRKHLLIGLNAAGSPAKATAQAESARETGLLSKSMIVRVPRDRKTRYPSGVVIGASRKVVRAFIQKGGVGKLLTDRKATKRVLGGGKVRVRKPSRYAHLAERKKPAIHKAARTLEVVGVPRMIQKIEQGIAAECAALPK